MDNRLGEFIRERRRNIGISLRKLEEMSGISFSHLSKIERGEHMPNKETLDSLGKALGIDQYEFEAAMGSESDMEFWKDAYFQLESKSEIDKNMFYGKDGKPDIVKFRNFVVHGGDKELSRKVLREGLTRLFTVMDSVTIKNNSNNFNVESYIDIQNDSNEDDEWENLVVMLKTSNYKPKQILQIIDQYERIHDIITEPTEE